MCGISGDSGMIVVQVRRLRLAISMDYYWWGALFDLDRVEANCTSWNELIFINFLSPPFISGASSDTLGHRLLLFIGSDW